TADTAGIAAVERVVPDVQLPDAGRIDGRDEVAGVVHDVHDVLVGADAVEGRHFVGGQFVGGDFQAPAAVREAHHAPLLFAPFEDGQIPSGPLTNLRGPRAFETSAFVAEAPVELHRLGIRVVVFLKPQQA